MPIPAKFVGNFPQWEWVFPEKERTAGKDSSCSTKTLIIKRQYIYKIDPLFVIHHH